MMDPVHPWVDPQEMRRLAEALMTAPALPPKTSDEACYGGDFVGFAQNGAPQNQPSMSAPTFPTPTPVSESLTVTASENPPVVEAVLRPAAAKVRGPFLERLSRFHEWLHSRGLVQGLFVLDKEGAVIFDDGDHERLHFMARSLAMAAKRSPDGAGHVQIKVGSKSLLEVIPVETVYGRMVLGLIVEQPLSAIDVAPLTTALQRAVAPPQP